MRQLFEINETEKQRILEMYISEQQTKVREFKSSTDNMRMYNFPNPKAKSSNSIYGLQGDSKLENYYFTSTVADLVNQSKKESSEYLKNFTPVNDAKVYVDFISINGKEINGSGTQTFDINKNSKIIATHNGLLSIKRVMDQMKSANYIGDQARITITIAGEERSSEFKTYDPNRAKDVNSTANTLLKYFATLIVPTQYRENIDDIVVNNIKKNPTNDIKNSIKNIINSSLVTGFLPDQKEWKSVKEQYKLKGYDSMSSVLDPILQNAEYGRNDKALDQSLWNNFWKSYKDAYLYNYSQYVINKYPEKSQELINDMKSSIQNQVGSYTLRKAFDNLFAKKRYASGPSTGNPSNQGKQLYGTGQ
jgi:hypothetical protein